MTSRSARHRLSAPIRMLACLALVLSAGGLAPGPAAAQWGDAFEMPRADPYQQPPRRRARESYGGDGNSYAPRPQPRRYAPQPQEQRQYFWPWEERPQQAQPQPQYQPRRQAPAQAPVPAPRTYSRPARPRPPAVASAPEESRPASVRQRRPTPRTPTLAQQPAKPATPKTAPNIQIAVFGDSLASYLSKGLDDAFTDNADVAVIDKSRGDSGIVRKDVVDWPKAAEDYLKANPKTAYGLFMVGVNDRQAIREGSESYEPLSDKWREVYAARIDALVKVFVEHNVPLIWVDTPPVRFESMNKDIATINDIVRERVRKAGQTYVDIWPGFVDDKNRFTTVGPDLDGQRATLRTTDGIHFTNPGARKLAHFADIELKRIMAANGTLPAEQPAEIAATPGSGSDSGAAALDDTAAIDRKITAMLPSLPEPPGIPSLPVKPAAGPLVPLGRAETSPGGALISSRPREGDPLGTVERTLQRGVAPMSQPGRADDFRWPPG